MGFFTAQTEVVELDGENRVVIRKLTFAEQQEIISVASRVATVSGRPEMTMDVFRMRLEQVKRAVVSWEGPGFEGRACTPENIGALPGEIGTVLIGRVDALNARLSDEEKKASAGLTS